MIKDEAQLEIDRQAWQIYDVIFTNMEGQIWEYKGVLDW